MIKVNFDSLPAYFTKANSATTASNTAITVKTSSFLLESNFLLVITKMVEDALYLPPFEGSIIILVVVRKIRAIKLARFVIQERFMD